MVVSWGSMRVYPLVNVYITMENHHFLRRKLTINGHVQLLFWHILTQPEGNPSRRGISELRRSGVLCGPASYNQSLDLTRLVTLSLAVKEVVKRSRCMCVYIYIYIMGCGVYTHNIWGIVRIMWYIYIYTKYVYVSYHGVSLLKFWKWPIWIFSKRCSQFLPSNGLAKQLQTHDVTPFLGSPIQNQGDLQETAGRLDNDIIWSNMI